MKKEKHTEETPEVNEVKQETETPETPQAEETSEQAAEQIADDLEVLTQKCAELNDKNLRLMAEFDNYRKRTLKERMDLIKTAGESVLVNMLPLIDDFERAQKAMETSEDVVAVKEGVELIYNKFIAFLMQNGVKAIPTENEEFNTDLHEAITTFPAPTEDLKGKIVDCVSKGYTLNDKVIRFSKVVVGE
ncbi:MAG: nucleotide exchange factor GrpE [Bacteroidales bacterium]|nr:nucleotide exchange factor GrpE [Bacteroidales bacterium]